jgi:hypothetical protein
MLRFSRFAQQRLYRWLPRLYTKGVKETTPTMTTLLTPDSSATHKFVFSEDTVTVTFTYNLEKDYSFAVNQEATTVSAIQNLIEAADSKGKMLAELRKEGMLVAI